MLATGNSAIAAVDRVRTARPPIAQNRKARIWSIESQVRSIESHFQSFESHFQSIDAQICSIGSQFRSKKSQDSQAEALVHTKAARFAKTFIQLRVKA
jgi:hypothetical protein